PKPPTRIGAEAMAAGVGAPPRALDGAPYAALAPAGGSVVDAAPSTVIGGVGTIELPSVTVSGGPVGGVDGTATTTATVWRVELFGGRVRAGDVRVDAMASLTDGQASVGGDVSIEGLVVDGVPYPAPELNQQIPLPGIGTLVVRERSLVQFGPAAATVFVRAFRIVPFGASVAGVPDGSEIVIGAATAGVPGFALAPPRVIRSDAIPTVGEYVAISTRAPIDLSVPQPSIEDIDFDNDNDDFDNDNDADDGDDDADEDEDESENDNGGTVTRTGTPRETSSDAPVVVTVVVVVQTPTPGASPAAR
ncbi:MAG: hypothetical protein M3O34_00670, partial [Chloroflexota bacterium]|nr:hypothetical protein [Chloroflexota bacterium]